MSSSTSSAQTPSSGELIQLAQAGANYRLANLDIGEDVHLLVSPECNPKNHSKGIITTQSGSVFPFELGRNAPADGSSSAVEGTTDQGTTLARTTGNADTDSRNANSSVYALYAQTVTSLATGSPLLLYFSPGGFNLASAGFTVTLGRTTPNPFRRKRPAVVSFADLPGEIKNMVYDYSLVPYDDDSLFIKPSPRNRRLEMIMPGGRPIARNLLCVNKQIHREAAPFLYSKNKFEFMSMRAVYLFMREIGATNRAMVRHIIIQPSWTPTGLTDVPGFDSLVGATRLETLTFSMRYTSTNAKRSLLRAARFWFEEVARKRGSKSAAVDLIRIKNQSADFLDEMRQFLEENL